MTVKTKVLLLMIFIVFTGFFISGYTLGKKKGDRASEATINSLTTIISSYFTIVNDNKTYISRVEQEIKTLREAKKDADVRNEELRKLNIKHLNELTRAKLRIDTLLDDINHNGQIVVIKDTVYKAPKNAMILPFTFNKADEWLSLKGTFNSQGKLDMSLKMDVNVDLWTAYDKKTKTHNAYLTTTNPYIGVLAIKSQKYDIKKPKPYGIGLHVGYGISKSGLSPVVSMGLNYSLIHF